MRRGRSVCDLAAGRVSWLLGLAGSVALRPVLDVLLRRPSRMSRCVEVTGGRLRFSVCSVVLDDLTWAEFARCLLLGRELSDVWGRELDEATSTRWAWPTGGLLLLGSWRLRCA